MKILFVASGNSSTGISSLVKNQGESLKKQGIDLDYFPIKGKGIQNYLKHISLLRNLLNENSYDIIHAHYGLCGMVAQLARKKEKIIVSLMGDDLIGSVSKRGNYSLFGDLLVKLNRLFLNSYNFLITKSENLHVNRKFQPKTVIIPNGVDLNSFYEIDKVEAKQKVKYQNNKRLIIFVSDSARPEKNFELAQQSVTHLREDNLELMVVNSIEHTQLKYYYNAADLLLSDFSP